MRRPHSPHPRCRLGLKARQGRRLAEGACQQPPRWPNSPRDEQCRHAQCQQRDAEAYGHPYPLPPCWPHSRPCTKPRLHAPCQQRYAEAYGHSYSLPPCWPYSPTDTEQCRQFRSEQRNAEAWRHSLYPQPPCWPHSRPCTKPRLHAPCQQRYAEAYGHSYSLPPCWPYSPTDTEQCRQFRSEQRNAEAWRHSEQQPPIVSHQTRTSWRGGVWVLEACWGLGNSGVRIKGLEMRVWGLGGGLNKEQ
mmetsp:Transcript_32883/g.76570  ORF Transcript_32883/g.76570 Transcript_32883/m.76570 type:complete len:246 (+) Transcript_32883:194-931(+)